MGRLTEVRLRFADFVACGGDGLSGAAALASELPGTRKPKKRGAIPGGAGNGAGDGRET